MFAYSWLGSEAMHLDAPHIASCGDMVIGCYGGNRAAGAHKNEDGALLLCAEDCSWHFAALCDAHVSSESAQLLLQTLEAEQSSIVAALSLPAATALPTLSNLIISWLASDDFRAKCQRVQGETARLICAQKEQWLWWLSIGDCVVYLFHPELAHLGQFALNQRNFYEWVGKVNTFDLPLPAYATGIRELRQGWNCMLMVTDGLLECGSRPFEDSRALYEVILGSGEQDEFAGREGVTNALARVHEEQGRDSATVIRWGTESRYPSAAPSG